MKLTILDYCNASVDIYDVDTEDVDEEYLKKLGYKASECSWMVSNDVNIHINERQRNNSQ